MKKVIIRYISESDDGVEFLRMSEADAKKCQSLLKKAQKVGEWPDEINEILQRAETIEPYATISSEGDGWGWYK